MTLPFRARDGRILAICATAKENARLSSVSAKLNFEKARSFQFQSISSSLSSAQCYGKVDAVLLGRHQQFGVVADRIRCSSRNSIGCVEW